MDKKYKIGEISERLSTSIRTIRYYEEEGLLQPQRSEGGTRFYTQRHISRLRAILHLVENGFSIQSIRLLGSMRDTCKTGNESSIRVSEQLDRTCDEISRRIHELLALKKEIEKAEGLVKQCSGCNNPPTSKGCPSCPVKAHADREVLLSLIWDQEE